MVAASMYAGEGWHDHPSCVPPTIRKLAIAANDLLPDGERERIIGPVLFEPLGRDMSDAAEVERAQIIADWAVRRYVLNCGVKRVEDWATKWLSYEDRTETAAEAAEAAKAAKAEAAAGAASWAAEAEAAEAEA